MIEIFSFSFFFFQLQFWMLLPFLWILQLVGISTMLTHNLIYYILQANIWFLWPPFIPFLKSLSTACFLWTPGTFWNRSWSVWHLNIRVQRQSLMSAWILFDSGFVEIPYSLITRIISKVYKAASVLESLRHTAIWKMVTEALLTEWLTEKWESTNGKQFPERNSIRWCKIRKLVSLEETPHTSLLRYGNEMLRTHRGENWFSLKCTLDIQSQNSFNKINKCYSRRSFPGQIHSVKSMGRGYEILCRLQMYLSFSPPSEELRSSFGGGGHTLEGQVTKHKSFLAKPGG